VLRQISNFFKKNVSNIEKKLNFKEVEKSKEITEKEIEKITLEIETIILPLHEEIEKLRKSNPKREVGGRIKNGRIELLEESRWEEHAVVGESYEEERRMGKEGIVSFHTHPEDGLTSASAQDILTAAFRLRELIFHKDGMTLLLPLEELPIDQIQKIDEQAWEEAQADEMRWGDPAYWFWKRKLQQRLPIRIVEIVNKNKSQ